MWDLGYCSVYATYMDVSVWIPDDRVAPDTSKVITPIPAITRAGIGSVWRLLYSRLDTPSRLPFPDLVASAGKDSRLLRSFASTC